MHAELLAQDGELVGVARAHLLQPDDVRAGVTERLEARWHYFGARVCGVCEVVRSLDEAAVRC